MNTEFKYTIIRDNYYQMVVYQNNQIADVFERYDPRPARTAKIALFGVAARRWASFDNLNVDTFLFGGSLTDE